MCGSGTFNVHPSRLSSREFVISRIGTTNRTATRLYKHGRHGMNLRKASVYPTRRRVLPATSFPVLSRRRSAQGSERRSYPRRQFGLCSRQAHLRRWQATSACDHTISSVPQCHGKYTYRNCLSLLLCELLVHILGSLYSGVSLGSWLYRSSGLRYRYLWACLKGRHTPPVGYESTLSARHRCAGASGGGTTRKKP